MIRFHIANTIMIIGGLLMVVRFMFLTTWLAKMPNLVPLVIILAASFYKTYLRSSLPGIRDPMQYGIPKILFYVAILCLVLSVVLKIMHWPGGFFVLSLCALLQGLALVLSFVLEPVDVKKSPNDEILDRD